MVAKLNTHLAVVTQGPKQARLVTDRPIPSLRDDYMLVRTVTGKYIIHLFFPLLQ